MLLTGRGCDTAAISLEYLGIKEFFSLCYFGAPEKNDKTGQLLHLCQTRQLKKEELVYVGDHPVNDVDASRRAGYTPVWVKTLPEWQFDELRHAEYEIDSVKELWEVLEKLCV